MPYIKAVDEVKCPYCRYAVVKFGNSGNRQRYRCKGCQKTFMQEYLKKAYKATTNSMIAAFVREGCGILSIARLL